MSRQAKPAKNVPAPAPTSKGFDPKRYASNTVPEDEVTNIKAAFDLFDSDQGGSVDIKGTTNNIQNSKQQ